MTSDEFGNTHETHPPRRILAFEPFDAGSHRAVRRAIEKYSEHEWTWITRPGRGWKWRMRLAAVEMIEEAHRRGALRGRPFDAIFLTSLMSAADLRALLPRGMRDLPIVLYMHENQAAYPEGRATEEPRRRDLQFALTNLTSILSAERVLWNSRWNRKSFLDGLAGILSHAPDLKITDWDGRIRSKSAIAWPPVDVPGELRAGRSDGEPNAPSPRPERDAIGPGRVLRKTNAVGGGEGPSRDQGERGPIRVVWPHRWEHDKGPEDLLEVARVHTASLNLRWILLGETYRKIPPAIETFLAEFADRIDHAGFLPDREAYLEWLCRADWVLSTARHEFFGIAVAEAMWCGCLPWLPERLSYPELLPAGARGLSPMTPPRVDELPAVRRAIRAHLKPALAPNAVALIDEQIKRVVEQDAGAGGSVGDLPENMEAKAGRNGEGSKRPRDLPG